MAAKKYRTAAPPAEPRRVTLWNHHGPALGALALLLLVFYWEPLFSSGTSIQWDAVDVHYSSQKYFADRLWSGELPHWTPYIFSGFPFLADPQVGAWYPLNWPFFLAGISPNSIEWELALHALIACLGAYALAWRFLRSRMASLYAAIAYGLSGFFAGHSSHVGMFQTAALLPWLLWGFFEALEPGRFWVALATGAAGGAMTLAGHFQTSLYAFAALTLAATTQWRNAKRAAVVLAAIVVTAALISSVQTLPGLELTGQSIRAGADYSRSDEGSLRAGALGTLVVPDAMGAISGTFQGSGDVTQYYFYAGLLTLPLALLGLRSPKLRWLALVLILPPLWYMIGPAGGLYRVVDLLPGFKSVRAPVHFWFVVGLGLALLAGSGVALVMDRLPGFARWAAVAIVVLTALDLFYWNSARNPLAYARASFEELYGQREAQVAANLLPQVPAGTRLHAVGVGNTFGPANHPLDLKLEATYGYNPLELRAYAEFVNEAEANPKLLDGLNVSRVFRRNPPGLQSDPGMLPKAYFTEPTATAQVTGYGEQFLRVRTHAAQPNFLHVSIPYYPGWQAITEGKSLPVQRNGRTLSGVMVPAGDHELELRFRSQWFWTGAVVSLLALLGVAAGGWWTLSSNRKHP